MCSRSRCKLLLQLLHFWMSGLLRQVEVAVHELIVIEVWRDIVLPHLLATDSAVVDRSAGCMNLQLVCGHEVTLVGLLEVVLYHRDAWDRVADDEMLLELVDYCYRKVVYLNSDLVTEDVQAAELDSEMSAKEMLKVSAMVQHENKMKEWRFRSAIAALSILRYLTRKLGFSKAQSQIWPGLTPVPFSILCPGFRVHERTPSVRDGQAAGCKRHHCSSCIAR